VTCSPSRWFAALAAALLALPAWGQTDPCAAKSFEDRLLKRYTVDACWKGDAALHKRFEGVTRGFAGKDAEALTWLDLARGQLRAQAAAVQASAGGARQFQDLNDRLGLALTQMDGLRSIDQLGGTDGAQRFPLLQINQWDVDGPPANFGMRHLEEKGCSDKAPPDEACAAAYATAVELTDHVFVVKKVLSVLREPEAAAMRAQFAQREARWASYFYDTQFPFWWELAANRYLEQYCGDGFHGKVGRLLVDEACKRPKEDPAGNPLEWREPPRYRAIFLHPDIGVQYLREEPRGERLKPALVFQWVGYQWWDWKGDKVADVRALSLVSTVADTATQKRHGLGVQVQWKGFAVALTRHGSELAVTLNLMLVDRMKELDEEWSAKLKRLKD